MTDVAGSTDRDADGRATLRQGLWAPFAALLSGQGVAALLGFVFWLVAARVVEPVQLGLAAAAISTQTLLGLVVSLGLGTHLVTVLPHADRGVVRRWLWRALAGAGLVGVVTAGVVVLVLLAVGALAPGTGGALRHALLDPVAVGLFVAGVVAATGVLVLDEAVLGLRRSRVQLTRNVTASLLRFPVGALLLAVAGAEAWVVQAAWVLPLLVSLGLALRSLRLPVSPPARWADDARDHLRPALRHYAVNLAVAAATQVVPVIAALSLGAADNAAFAVAWLLATCAFLAPYLLATALYAHASHDGPDASGEPARDVLAGHLRRTVPSGIGLVVAAWVAVVLVGETVLRAFGETYAEDSAHLLVLLVPAGVWMVVKDHLVVVWRRERRYRLATVAAVVSLVAECAGAVVGAGLDGATGLVLGWLLVMAVELLVGAPVLVRRMGLRRGRGVPRRNERGRASWSLVALLVISGLLAVSLVIGLAVIGREPRTNGPDEVTGTAACVPSPENPGPELDLTVKVDTGDPERPFRSAEEVDALVAAADEAGADIISTSLSWRVAQRTRGGAYDFRGLDRVVDAARERGLDVRVQLLHMVFWAFDPGATKFGPWAPPRSTTELARWRTFVNDTTAHLDGRARYVEIWSSPDLDSRWRTGADPAEYARMIQVSAAAVKSADPGVEVVTGGLDGDPEYLREMLDQFSGRQLPFDLLGLHVFGDEGSMIDPQALYTSTTDVVADSGTDIPIYVTEMGWSTKSLPDGTRADRTATTLDAITCDSRLQIVSWYALHQSRWDGPRWALLESADEPTLTYEALAEWTRRRELAVGDAG